MGCGTAALLLLLSRETIVVFLREREEGNVFDLFNKIGEKKKGKKEGMMALHPIFCTS